MNPDAIIVVSPLVWFELDFDIDGHAGDQAIPLGVPSFEEARRRGDYVHVLTL